MSNVTFTELFNKYKKANTVDNPYDLPEGFNGIHIDHILNPEAIILQLYCNLTPIFVKMYLDVGEDTSISLVKFIDIDNTLLSTMIIDNSALKDLEDIIYTSLVYNEYLEHAELMLAHCNFYNLTQPKNLMGVHGDDYNWTLLDTDLGIKFLEENHLKFIQHTTEHPYNELLIQDESHDLPQSIVTTNTGKMIINHIGSDRVMVFMDPPPGLANIMKLHANALKSTSMEIAIRHPGVDLSIYVHQRTCAYKLARAAFDVERFTLHTEETANRYIRALMN